MLAGEEPSLQVEGVAVGIPAGFAEPGDPARGRPTEELVLGDVAEDQQALAGEPDGPLGEREAGGEALDLRVGGEATCEFRGIDGGEIGRREGEGVFPRGSSMVCLVLGARAA